MGQKINPTIFRLNKTKNWKSRYIEKKITETKIFNFKNNDIRDFIIRFFDLHKIYIHDLKLSYYNNTLSIYISHFSSFDTISLINTNNKTQKIKLVTKKIHKTKFLKYNKIKKSIKNFIIYNKLNNFKPNKKSHLNRIRFLSYYKQYLLTQNYKQINNIYNNSFINDFFLILTRFTNNKINISLTLYKLNNDIKYKIKQKEIKILKKSLVKLRKYENNDFFKKGLNILFLCMTKKNSAMLLTNFIANQLKILKRHNFFLRFLKTALTSFYNTRTFSKLEGIKIKVKGRFNKAPRARHKIIEIGNSVSTLSLKSKIDYYETTAFSPNGTFGVKVWICEK
jgi:hypothetical protein